MKLSDRYLSSLSEEGRYRLLVEAVTDYAIYLLDPSGIITTWNPGAQRIKGYTAHEIIGQHFSRFYTEEDRKLGLPARALQTAEREGKFEAEGWRVRKDGSRFWAYIIIDPIRAPSGEIIGFAKITRDLTERKVAEQVLRQSEEQFRLLVQGVSDYAIYMLDTDGRVTNWNLGAQRIKGYRQTKLSGSTFRVSTQTRTAQQVSLRKHLRQPRKWDALKEKAGASARTERAFGRMSSSMPFATMAEMISVTPKSHATSPSGRKLRRNWKRPVSSRCNRRSWRRIGQLTGGIAHDFNNLLSAVLGSLELLRKRLPDDPRAVALLENATQGAQRGTTLTKRMLAFARNYELKKEVTGVPELVRGMTELLQRSVGPSYSIETRFPLALKPVEVDANQLELALLNLSLNARDAMPDGGDIILSAREERIAAANRPGLEAGQYIRISVIDTGEGMDEETLRKAAEPFFTTKGVGKGTGLGLSMVHGFAEQSGGRLILYSQKGSGTTAELWLPVAKTSAQPVAPAQVTPAKMFRPLTVLAVDDDALVLMNTVATLEDLGHTVFEAYSAKEALEILRREDSVDLIVADHAMPKMTGTELAKVVRSEWPDIPVLLATGYADRVPGDDIGLPKLTKPFMERDLRAAIERMNPPRRKPERVVPLRPRSAPKA